MMPNRKKIIGSNIKALREESGLTQEEFAKELGVSKGAVSQWENSTGEPSPLPSR